MKLYCLRDELVKYYDPFMAENDEKAIIIFEDLREDINNTPGLRIEYFSLNRVGEFDNQTGILVAEEQPVLIRDGAELQEEIMKTKKAEEELPFS